MAAPGKLSEATLSWEPVRMVSSVKEGSDFSISTLELSALDILMDIYNSALLVYHRAHDGHDGDEPVAERLQRALEELLEHYPCAAGVLVQNSANGRFEVRYPTIKIDSMVRRMNSAAADGGDAQYGVPFQVAQADLALSDLGDMSEPHPSFELLYPRKPTFSYDINKGRANPRFVMGFQITSFKCGSITLGFMCSHLYADGHTGAAFLQSLCSIARGVGLAPNSPDPPSFRSRTEIFSPSEPLAPSTSTLLHQYHTRYILARKPALDDQLHQLHYGTATRFVFSMEALQQLRAHVSATPNKRSCSRNQALAALLWSAYARVRLVVRGNAGSDEMFLRFPVDLRRRGIPKLTHGYMGNAIFHCSVHATLQELCESPLAQLVEKIRITVENIDFKACVQLVIDYTELQLREGRMPFMELGLTMPSLVGLPFYDTDFGWGAPAYVGRPSAQLQDRCIIMDHPAAKAWNVLAVFPSPEEHACFQEAIAQYINPIKNNV